MCLYLSWKFLCKRGASEQKLPLASVPHHLCWRAHSTLERSCPEPLEGFDKNPLLAHGLSGIKNSNSAISEQTKQRLQETRACQIWSDACNIFLSGRRDVFPFICFLFVHLVSFIYKSLLLSKGEKVDVYLHPLCIIRPWPSHMCIVPLKSMGLLAWEKLNK